MAYKAYVGINEKFLRESFFIPDDFEIIDITYDYQMAELQVWVRSQRLEQFEVVRGLPLSISPIITQFTNADGYYQLRCDELYIYNPKDAKGTNMGYKPDTV